MTPTADQLEQQADAILAQDRPYLESVGIRPKAGKTAQQLRWNLSYRDRRSVGEVARFPAAGLNDPDEVRVDFGDRPRIARVVTNAYAGIRSRLTGVSNAPDATRPARVGGMEHAAAIDRDVWLSRQSPATQRFAVLLSYHLPSSEAEDYLGVDGSTYRRWRTEFFRAMDEDRAPTIPFVRRRARQKAA